MYLTLLLCIIFFVCSCSQKSESPIVDKWEESPPTEAKLTVEFSIDGKCVQSLLVESEVLRMSGDYHFIDEKTIKADFKNITHGVLSIPRGDVWIFKDIKYSNEYLEFTVEETQKKFKRAK